MNAPTSDMLAVAEKLAGFIAGRGEALPPDLFAPAITIVENFAPFVFHDAALWAEGMRAHLQDLSGLAHRFGAPVDFSRHGRDAYFSLPTTWTGFIRGVPFRETGGWALVLTETSQGWRLKAYGWAVIETASE